MVKQALRDANVHGVVLVEFSTGWAVVCDQTRQVIRAVYDELVAVADLCTGKDWWIVAIRLECAA